MQTSDRPESDQNSTTNLESDCVGGSRSAALNVTRRDFVKTSAAIAGAFPFVGAAAWAAASANARGRAEIRVGLIGCGGRGTGAAWNSIEAAPNTRIVALADVFQDRLEGCRNWLNERGERTRVSDERCYVGFDAYQRLIDDSEADLIILATPPHFRPIHFEAAIKAGKHVFTEKPVASDPAGIRRFLAAADLAETKGLSVVAGTQRRHEASYLAAMKQLRDGLIGDLVAARCYWNQGGLWVKEMQPGMTEMEWQIRNWLYFTWLSGDHIVEQHVHNLDVVNWAFGAHPVKCMGMGGRQVRTEAKYGNIFDHFAIEYEYPNGAFLQSMCRQIDGCASRVEEVLHGTHGRIVLRPGYAETFGDSGWRFEGDNPNPYVREHTDLVASIEGSGPPLNEARRVAESTLTAIMGRMSAYTGQEVTWDQALNSTLDLAPEAYEFGPVSLRPVATPGKTPLV